MLLCRLSNFSHPILWTPPFFCFLTRHVLCALQNRSANTVRVCVACAGRCALAPNFEFFYLLFTRSSFWSRLLVTIFGYTSMNRIKYVIIWAGSFSALPHIKDSEDHCHKYTSNSLVLPQAQTVYWRLLLYLYSQHGEYLYWNITQHVSDNFPCTIDQTLTRNNWRHISRWVAASGSSVRIFM